MEPKDERPTHFFYSLVKSGIRIGGCILAMAVLFIAVEPAVLTLAMTFAAAEVVGIMEEL